MFGSPETQPGGRALKFYSSQRLDIRRIETLKEGTEAVGNRVRVKVVKNKVAPPFRQAEFDIEFGKGISTAGCLIDLGIENNVVTKSGSFFSYGDERLGQGRNNAKAFLNEHVEIAKEIESKIYEALGINRDLVTPIDSSDTARRAVTSRRCRPSTRRRERTCSISGQLTLRLSFRRRSTSASATSATATARWPRCAATSSASAWSRPPSTARSPSSSRLGLPRRRALRAALRRGPPSARRLGRRAHRAPPARAGRAAGPRGRRGRRGRRPRRARRRRRACCGAGSAGRPRPTATATGRWACSPAAATSSSSPTTRSAHSSAAADRRGAAAGARAASLRPFDGSTTIRASDRPAREAEKVQQIRQFREPEASDPTLHRESPNRTSASVEPDSRTEAAPLKRGRRAALPPLFVRCSSGRSVAP